MTINSGKTETNNSEHSSFELTFGFIRTNQSLLVCYICSFELNLYSAELTIVRSNALYSSFELTLSWFQNYHNLIVNPQFVRTNHHSSFERTISWFLSLHNLIVNSTIWSSLFVRSSSWPKTVFPSVSHSVSDLTKDCTNVYHIYICLEKSMYIIYALIIYSSPK